ncbi:MAG TPA: DMT family transporter [Woeseiaceae bacterium]|jgi:drug/metabolite transporter (DMT)-like permease
MTYRDRIELILLGAIWGASFLFMRVAAPEFGPFALVELRVGIAALFLLAILLWRRGIRKLLPLVLPLTIVGIASSALPFVLFAYATLSISAGTAAVLNATAPLFAALVGYAWLHEKLRPLQCVGLAVGFAGVVLLVWDRMSVNVEGAVAAAVACLVATLSYGVAVNFTKKKLAGVPALVNATGSQIAASLLLLPLAAVYWPAKLPGAASWYSAVALGVVCTGIAFVLYFRLIARIGPAKAITVTYLVPVFGMLWGLIFLHEPISAGMVAACLVVFFGIALATGKRPSAAAPVQAHLPVTSGDETKS